MLLIHDVCTFIQIYLLSLLILYIYILLHVMYVYLCNNQHKSDVGEN